MLLIPAIDLIDGRCVRLFKGDFKHERQYDHDPQELLRRYSNLGASWLHIVDLDGAKDGEMANRALILALASEHALKVQVGGGVRSREVIEDLLAHGVERVVVGSAAVEEPRSVIAWLKHFGCERLCLAFDVRLDAFAVPRVRTHGWAKSTPLDLWRAVKPFLAHGLKHVLCTDVERDGTLAGPNVALYTQATAHLPQLAWQASGGVRDADDVRALAATGVVAAICGRALLEGRINLEELQAFLPNASLPVSTCATAAS
jgi:phosphoribosylformimino-5-aminoimidazole carboxamide ribotide isomerase